MTGEQASQTVSPAAQDRLVLATTVVDLLKSRGETLATAESLTGGLVAAALTDVAGSSAVVRGGLVAYVTEVKRDVLGVDAAVLRRHGSVSAQTAAEMTAQCLELFAATWAVSTTGVAGPDRQEGQPVGTVYVGVARSAGADPAGADPGGADPARADPDGVARSAGADPDRADSPGCVSWPDDVAVKTTRFTFAGSRDDIRVATVQAALKMLRERLIEVGLGGSAAATSVAEET